MSCINNLQRIKSYLTYFYSPRFSSRNMNKSIKNHKMLLLSNNLAAFNEEPLLSSQSNTARKTEPNQKLMPSKQKPQILPEISSPFLKRAVYNLFSQRRMQQSQPILPQTNSNQKMKQKIQKSKSLTGSLKEDQFIQSKKQHPKRKQVKTQAKEFINEHLIPKRVPKIFKQSKNSAQLINFQYADMKKSLDMIQSLKNKSNEKSYKYSRTNTEETQSNFQSSKAIFSKLQNLHLRDSHVIYQTKEKEFVLKRNHSKQLKPPGFVLKQKLSKQIYRQQREQIKLVKEVIESSKGQALAKGLNVKNYTNFFHQIINIDD